MTLITIHNTDTDEIIEREMTAEELSQFDLDKAKANNAAIAQTKLEATKKAILEKLGLTADEVAALLA